MTALWSGNRRDSAPRILFDGRGEGYGQGDGDGYGYGDGFFLTPRNGSGQSDDDSNSEDRNGDGYGSRYGYPEQDVGGSQVAIEKAYAEHPTLPIAALAILAVTS